MNQDQFLRWQDLENRITVCRKCERLVAWREHVAQTRKKVYRDWDYWGKPVPGFGDYEGQILSGRIGTWGARIKPDRANVYR